MKWYSVKKYKPPFGSFLLLVAIKNWGYRLASFDEPNFWYDNDDCPIPIEDITHFAVFDPVEIEE